MSIVPINGHSFSLDTWDPFNNLEIWSPFPDFTFPFLSLLSSHFPDFSGEILPSVETQLRWTETQKAHVFKAYLPGLTKDEVIVFIDEENMLQICTDNNKFMSRFKLPDNANTDHVKASMENGYLVVTVAKKGAQSSNVRVVEITE